MTGIENLLNTKRAEIEATLAGLDTLADPLEAAASAMIAALESGGRILAAGNGGSAAEAQHFTGELVGRFMRERKALPAICLHGDTSATTAISNDYGYEQVFARQVEAHGTKGDTLLLLSTSGASKNLVAAAVVAAEIEITTVALLGRTRGELHGAVDIPVSVPSDVQSTIQEMHLVLVHALAEAIESRLFD